MSVLASEYGADMWHLNHVNNQTHHEVQFNDQTTFCKLQFMAENTILAGLDSNLKKLHLWNVDQNKDVEIKGNEPEILDFLAVKNYSELLVFQIVNGSYFIGNINLNECSFTKVCTVNVSTEVNNIKLVGIIQDIYLTFLCSEDDDMAPVFHQFTAWSINLNTGAMVSCQHENIHCPGGGIPNTVVHSAVQLNKDVVMLGCSGAALAWTPPNPICEIVKQKKDYIWLQHDSVVAMADKKGKRGQQKQAPITMICTSEDGSVMATGDDEGGLVLWHTNKLSDGKLEKEGRVIKKHDTMVSFRECLCNVIISYRDTRA